MSLSPCVYGSSASRKDSRSVGNANRSWYVSQLDIVENQGVRKSPVTGDRGPNEYGRVGNDCIDDGLRTDSLNNNGK